MKKNRSRLGLASGAIALCLTLAIGKADAVTLDSLIGSSITAGGLLFDNWEVTQTGPVSAVDLTKIDVEPLVDVPLNPGLQFLAQPGTLRAGDTGIPLVSLLIGFDVSVGGPPPVPDIKDNSLEFRKTVNGTADVGITESVRDASGNLLAMKVVSRSTFFAEAEFAPQTLISVEKDIFAEAGLGPGDFAEITRFTQRFSLVPLPAALWLFTPALATLAFVGRRRNRVV